MSQSEAPLETRTDSVLSSPFLPEPMDPYNARVVQFNALRSLGYPVRLVPIAQTELPERILAVEDHDIGFRNWLSSFATWVVPVSREPSFNRFVEEPDGLGEFFRSSNSECAPYMGEAADRLVSNHAAQLVSYLEAGSVNLIAETVQAPDDLLSWFNAPDGAPILGVEPRTIAKRALIAAFARSTEMSRRGYPIVDAEGHDLISDEAIRLHRAALAEGLQSLKPDEIIGLSVDYYRLVESLVPSMQSYKQRPYHGQGSV